MSPTGFGLSKQESKTLKRLRTGGERCGQLMLKYKAKNNSLCKLRSNNQTDPENEYPKRKYLGRIIRIMEIIE